MMKASKTLWKKDQVKFKEYKIFDYRISDQLILK